MAVTNIKKESKSSNAASGSKTLSDLGISADQSSRWQQLAKIPKGDFEAELATGERFLAH